MEGIFALQISRETVPDLAIANKDDFKISDLHAKKIISFPCDQHLSKKKLNYIIKTIKEFYKKK